MLPFTQRQDIANDQMIAMDLRSRVIDTINFAKKLQRGQAVANSDSLLDDYIHALDNTLADVIAPFERMLDEAEVSHDG